MVQKDLQKCAVTVGTAKTKTIAKLQAVVMKTQLPHLLGSFGCNVQFSHIESMYSLVEEDQQASSHN